MGIGNLVGSLPKVSNVTLVLAVMAVVATAATVAYISNAVTATATVNSPFEIVYVGPATPGATYSDNNHAVDFGALHGGDAFSVNVDLINNAQTAQYAKTVVTCTSKDMYNSPENINCAELAMNLSWSGGNQQLPVPCGNGGSYIEFITQTGDVLFAAGSHNVNTLNMKVAQTYLGKLSCSAQAFPSP